MITADLQLDNSISNMSLYIVITELKNEQKDTLLLRENTLTEFSYSFNISDQGFYSIEIVAEDDQSKYNSNKEYLVLSDFDVEKQFAHQNYKSIINFKNYNKNSYK